MNCPLMFWPFLSLYPLRPIISDKSHKRIHYKNVFDLNISYEQGKILSQIQNQAEIIDTDYGDKAIKLKIRGKEDSIKRLFK